MDEKKKYVIPEADVVDFTNEDIITASLNETAEWGDGLTEDF